MATWNHLFKRFSIIWRTVYRTIDHLLSTIDCIYLMNRSIIIYFSSIFHCILWPIDDYCRTLIYYFVGIYRLVYNRFCWITIVYLFIAHDYLSMDLCFISSDNFIDSLICSRVFFWWFRNNVTMYSCRQQLLSNDNNLIGYRLIPHSIINLGRLRSLNKYIEYRLLSINNCQIRLHPQLPLITAFACMCSVHDLLLCKRVIYCLSIIDYRLKVMGIHLFSWR